MEITITPVLLVGFFAGAITTISAIPQLYKSIKTKETKDLSLGMIILLLFGVTAWFVYGVLDKDWALIIANIIVIIVWGIILGYKLKYK
ncbi:SemiSWEET transporter [Patescibacteria group bacterium]|nr:SemiSWEET transporter [Patescibacteria group bacterium]MBU1673562.1 SemiSWEET transporter [Patescibacteria group bacterium]MBU1963640.1 SemiSWEET transporter [Patescibacteria group bacterium]